VPFRDPRQHLQDVVEAIARSMSSLETWILLRTKDAKTKAALERKIQILTEAIVRLDDECPGEFPEIDRKGYRGMGNILRHSYHRVNDEIVWRTVKEDLPRLKVAAEDILSRLPGN
jgi:uncharacterized protein with HEPN domain